MLSMMVIILMEVTSLPSLPTTASKEQMARPPKISETLISIIINYADISSNCNTKNYLINI